MFTRRAECEIQRRQCRACERLTGRGERQEKVDHLVDCWQLLPSLSLPPVPLRGTMANMGEGKAGCTWGSEG